MKVKDLVRILQQIEGIADYEVEIFNTETGETLEFHHNVDITHDHLHQKVFLEI